MALVTVQRSPGTNSPGPSTDELDGSDSQDGDEESTDKKSISECYFAVKGAALVLPHDECLHVHRKNIANGACDIQQHLQSMLYLLHADDILKMAVKLESIHSGRTRYLVVVYHNGTGNCPTDESCLLGIDCNKETTIGLLLPVWADTRITLDGDGGFSVTSSGRHHIFKPVSVQAMWSALQTLHKASSKARENNYFKCGGTHQWVEYYEKRIGSDRSCLNEWHAMDDIESRRPPSPDTIRLQPTEREETERHIRTKLKELMMSVDLDEVTSKFIRTRLEEILNMNLKEYKSFIDQEMLTILGQMDSPTEIFQYLYLGSEWNASNLEELVLNGIGHILNVTREIDNFFPGMFDYQNIRVYDDESTEILHYWDKTYRYIQRAKDEGSKVLVHCKMGISRSASVVIAYVMKAYDWDLQKALEFVKTKRGCIKPNSGFLKQLEIYQGILDASKQRHNSLWRSKSETNLKSASKPRKKDEEGGKKQKVPEKSESLHHLTVGVSGGSGRPKSWSPSEAVADMLFPSSRLSHLCNGANLSSGQTFAPQNVNIIHAALSDVEPFKTRETVDVGHSTTDLTHRNTSLPRVSSIKDRINELELQVTSTISEKSACKTDVKSPTSQSRSGLVFNLANQFESGSKPSSPVDEGLVMRAPEEELIVQPVVSQTKPPACRHHAVLVKPSLWPEDSHRVEPARLSQATQTAARLAGDGGSGEPCDTASDEPPAKTSHSSFRTVFPGKACLDKKQRKSAPVIHPDRSGCCKVKVPDSECPADGSRANDFYEKEEIPFTPGKVMRTKQKIEEKNLTRTMSFDSGMPFRTRSTPSTPPEAPGKPIRRSHSLRNEGRTAMPFCGKWYPLPALASDDPLSFRKAHPSGQSGHSVLSASTPSVVEAVNRVICGTQEVLSSAISFLPKKGTSGHSSSDSDYDFGSATSLPDVESKDPALGEGPAPGLVRLQRDILENKSAPRPSEQSQPLVTSEDIKDSGIVQRLKKELEAKSTLDASKKDRNPGAGLPDGHPTELTAGGRIILSVPLSEKNDSNAPGWRNANFEDPKAPPTPHRKTSLDLSFRRFPLNLKLASHAPVIRPRTGFGAAATSSALLAKSPAAGAPAEMPPVALPRKSRKQQGSSHPLSKLIKQRHPNPLYNTM